MASICSPSFLPFSPALSCLPPTSCCLCLALYAYLYVACLQLSVVLVCLCLQMCKCIRICCPPSLLLPLCLHPCLVCLCRVGVKFAVSNKPVRILKVTRFWYLLMHLFHVWQNDAAHTRTHAHTHERVADSPRIGLKLFTLHLHWRLSQ